MECFTELILENAGKEKDVGIAHANYHNNLFVILFNDPQLCLVCM